MIEEYNENISKYDSIIKQDAILTGIFALFSVGTLADILLLGPNGAEILMPAFTGIGAAGYGTALVSHLIEKFKYKKEMKELLEEYKRNNEEGMVLK